MTAGHEVETGVRDLMGRAEFCDQVGEALRAGTGYAAAKLGFTEQAWLQYPIARASSSGPALRALEVMLAHRSDRHAGIWPIDMEFLSLFADRFGEDLHELDAIGVVRTAAAAQSEILASLRPPGRPIWFQDQEPPLNLDEPCWLEHLRGRRVLLVCPFASVLAEQASGETYERVWAAVGKPWFEPESVGHLEFPYGFDPATRERYATSFDLLDALVAGIGSSDADCVLIAAGSLGQPLAAAAKRAGRVGISLGGHLQVLFGVHGARWRGDPFWERIINDAWIGVPERYRPDPAWTDADYW